MDTGAKVLVVDDEPNVLRSLAQYLTIEDFTVETASNGLEALEKVDSFLPELILLDVMMPGMDGPGTLMALRERPALVATPVAFMTAKVQPTELVYFKSLGALDVIPKPFDPMSLGAQVRAIWEKRHG